MKVSEFGLSPVSMPKADRRLFSVGVQPKAMLVLSHGENVYGNSNNFVSFNILLSIRQRRKNSEMRSALPFAVICEGIIDPSL